MDSPNAPAAGRPELEVPSLAPWHVVQTKYRQEELAINQLREQGITLYRPRLRAPRARGLRIESLFPNYLFVRIGSVEESVQVHYTWGVRKILGFGDRPCPVSDEFVELIRARESEDGCIRPSKVFRFSANDRVLLQGGAFHGLEALFQQYRPAKQRIQVLLTIMGRPLLLDIDQDRASPVY